MILNLVISVDVKIKGQDEVHSVTHRPFILV